MFAEIGELVMQYFKAIAFIPGDLILDTIYACVVLGACKSFYVLLDCIHSLPSAGACERD